MADEPDTDGNDAAEGGTARGNQGGHQGQPAGGQQPPQGGQQPASNAGAQGQGPPGQPPQGQYQTGPSIGDIFNRADTKTEIKIGTILFTLVTIGFGVTGFGAAISSGGGGVGTGSSLGGIAGGAASMIVLLFVPIVALVIGLRQADVLTGVPANLVYANAAATSFLGTLATFVVGLVFFLIGGAGGAIGDMIGAMIGPVIFAGLGAAIVAAGSVWVKLNIHHVPVGSQAHGEQQPAQR